MSYTNVYPSRINWENEPSIVSPINATNLNKMDYALYQHDQTFDTWDVTKANQSDLLLSVKTIDYDTETGVFVFTWQNGTTKTVDLNIEKIPVSFSMSPQGVITMTTDDGTTYTADVGALIKTYTFTDSSEIDFTVTTDASGNKTITAGIVAGSITGSKLEPNYLANCQSAAQTASNSATAADGSAEDSEAWAVGTRDGVPVPSTDPAYENNSKYWATQGGANSLAGLSDTDITSPTDGQVLTYNGTTSKWENDNPQAGGGSTVKITTTETTLKGKNVTITQGTTVLTATFDNSGVAEFTGVTLTGNVAVSASDGTQSTTKVFNIPYFGNYTFTVTFFSATITVTFPYSSGATCTLSDGITTLNASTSPMAFTVPNTGTWTATATLDGVSAPTQSKVITTDGQTESITIEFGTINLTYANEFRGVSISCVQSGTTITKTAPSSGNTMYFYPPSTGAWLISGVVSSQTYSTSATITSLSTAVSATLETVPDGSTVTPTDDIQTWLKCAGINDKTSYTTLADVLNDSTTLLALMSDNNAVDYLVRSKTWTTANGLVPTLSADDSKVVSCTALSGHEKWKVFDGNDSTDFIAQANTSLADYLIGYDFTSAKISKVIVKAISDSDTYYYNVAIYGSDDLTTFTKVSETQKILGRTLNTYTFTVTDSTSYKYHVLKIVDSNGASAHVSGQYALVVYTVQFYATSENQGICDNSTAMTDIGANNYCANTLLSDITWCTAICNSTYFESVLTTKVPTMTSNTTPSGECFGSGNLGANYDYYQAFSGNNSKFWAHNGVADGYLGYDFGTPVLCKRFRFNPLSSTSIITITYKIQGTNDLSGTWNDVSDTQTIETTSSVKYAGENSVNAECILTSSTPYRYYRYQQLTTSGGSNTNGGAMQFYGR